MSKNMRLKTDKLVSSERGRKSGEYRILAVTRIPLHSGETRLEFAKICAHKKGTDIVKLCWPEF